MTKKRLGNIGIDASQSTVMQIDTNQSAFCCYWQNRHCLKNRKILTEICHFPLILHFRGNSGGWYLSSSVYSGINSQILIGLHLYAWLVLPVWIYRQQNKTLTIQHQPPASHFHEKQVFTNFARCVDASGRWDPILRIKLRWIPDFIVKLFDNVSSETWKYFHVSTDPSWLIKWK